MWGGYSLSKNKNTDKVADKSADSAENLPQNPTIPSHDSQIESQQEGINSSSKEDEDSDIDTPTHEQTVEESAQPDEGNADEGAEFDNSTGVKNPASDQPNKSELTPPVHQEGSLVVPIIIGLCIFIAIIVLLIIFAKKCCSKNVKPGNHYSLQEAR